MRIRSSTASAGSIDRLTGRAAGQGKGHNVAQQLRDCVPVQSSPTPAGRFFVRAGIAAAKQASKIVSVSGPTSTHPLTCSTAAAISRPVDQKHTRAPATEMRSSCCCLLCNQWRVVYVNKGVNRNRPIRLTKARRAAHVTFLGLDLSLLRRRIIIEL